MPNTLLRMPNVRARTGLSKAGVYALMKIGRFPESIHLGSSRSVAWIEAEINEGIEERIRLARGQTIATAIEQADGLLDGLSAREARKASASCMPAVSEPPIEPIKTLSPSYEHHLNELERIRRENEVGAE